MGIKQAAKLGSVGYALYNALVKIDGKPVQERDRPAKVRIAGIPVFTRDEDGNRTLFGFAWGKRKGA